MQEASLLLSRHGVTGPFFVLHCSTGGTSRQWGVEQMGTVLKQVSKETGLVGVITGGLDDRSRQRALVGVFRLRGKRAFRV